MEKKRVRDDFGAMAGYYTVMLVLVSILAFTPFGHDLLSIWREADGLSPLYKPPALGSAYSDGVHKEAWHAYWESRPARSVEAVTVKTWIYTSEFVSLVGSKAIRLEVVTTDITKPVAESMFWLERVDGTADATYRVTPKPWVLARLKRE